MSKQPERATLIQELATFEAKAWDDVRGTMLDMLGWTRIELDGGARRQLSWSAFARLYAEFASQLRPEQTLKSWAYKRQRTTRAERIALRRIQDAAIALLEGRSGSACSKDSEILEKVLLHQSGPSLADAKRMTRVGRPERDSSHDADGQRASELERFLEPRWEALAEFGVASSASLQAVIQPMTEDVLRRILEHTRTVEGMPSDRELLKDAVRRRTDLIVLLVTLNGLSTRPDLDVWIDHVGRADSIWRTLDGSFAELGSLMPERLGMGQDVAAQKEHRFANGVLLGRPTQVRFLNPALAGTGSHGIVYSLRGRGDVTVGVVGIGALPDAIRKVAKTEDGDEQITVGFPFYNLFAEHLTISIESRAEGESHVAPIATSYLACRTSVGAESACAVYQPGPRSPGDGVWIWETANPMVGRVYCLSWKRTRRSATNSCVHPESRNQF
jgi:hypothetical protein